MREDLGRQLELLVDFALGEESAVEEVTVLILGDDGVPQASDQAPRTELLLDPDGQLVPNLAYTETLGVVAGRNFDHGERPYLRTTFRLFDEAVLYAQLHVGHAIGAREKSTATSNRRNVV